MVENEHKLVIVVRSDLNMSDGKIAAQAAHAAVSASEIARREHVRWWHRWMREGQRKVIAQARSESHLLELKAEADRRGLPNAVIEDLGLTEVFPGTITCLGVGPAPSRLVNKVTGSLPLL